MQIVPKPLVPSRDSRICFVGRSLQSTYKNGQDYKFTHYILRTLQLRHDSEELDIRIQDKILAEDFGTFSLIYPDSTVDVVLPDHFAVFQMPNALQLGIDLTCPNLPTQLPYHRWKTRLHQHRGWAWLVVYELARKYPNEIWQNKLQFAYRGTVGELPLDLREFHKLYRKGTRPLLDALNERVEQELHRRGLL